MWNTKGRGGGGHLQSSLKRKTYQVGLWNTATKIRTALKFIISCNKSKANICVLMLTCIQQKLLVKHILKGKKRLKEIIIINLLSIFDLCD